MTPKLPQTYGAWATYSEYVEDLVHLTHEGYRFILFEPEQLQLLGADEERVRSAEWKADRARREVENGFSMLHAHALLGLWGALESHVEDIFVSRLAESPSLLSEAAFEKVKIPASAAAQEPRVLAEAVLREVSRSTGADLASAPGRFERLLSCVGLGGPVPNQISHAIHHAHAIRNVWAHRGGVADARFVSNCPDLGVAIGERIELTMNQFSPLMHGMHMYTVLIVNRHRSILGIPLSWGECAGYEGVLAEIGVTLRDQEQHGNS